MMGMCECLTQANWGKLHVAEAKLLKDDLEVLDLEKSGAEEIT